MTATLVHGDCLEVLRGMPADSVDACVTDPPYGLRFMGKDWDHGIPGVPYWEAVSRVLKPGAYLLAFGGTRTHHRLMCAIEDAGFQIQDCLMWLHGQGFPKGKSQLKPAWEPIILARRPGKSAGLNVDACRLSIDAADDIYGKHPHTFGGFGHAGSTVFGDSAGHEYKIPAGRWPANVVLSHEDGCREVGTKRVKGDERGHPGGTRPGGFANIGASAGDGKPNGRVHGAETVPSWICEPNCAVRLLDEQAGERPSSYRQARTTDPIGSTWALKRDDQQPFGYTDQGSVSRFYFCAKASPADRRPYNDWPTVKNTDLMRWLITLVTPPGGTILDPFCGSGSTLVAADQLGFDCTGIDQDDHALDIARRRLHEDGGMFADVEG